MVGVTDTLPDGAGVVIHPTGTTSEQEVAPIEYQERVEELPITTGLGVAVRVTVGAETSVVNETTFPYVVPPALDAIAQ